MHLSRPVIYAVNIDFLVTWYFNISPKILSKFYTNLLDNITGIQSASQVSLTRLFVISIVIFSVFILYSGPKNLQFLKKKIILYRSFV